MPALTAGFGTHPRSFARTLCPTPVNARVKIELPHRLELVLTDDDDDRPTVEPVERHVPEVSHWLVLSARGAGDRLPDDGFGAGSACG